LDVRAVFRRDWRAAPPAWAAKSPLALDALDLLSFWSFRNDLKRAFRQTAFRSHDLVFGQMITPRHLAAWLEWLSALPSSGAPALAVHVAYDPSRFFAHKRLKRALRMFKESSHRERLIPVTDTSRLAATYGELIGKEVLVLPHVINPSIGNLSSFPEDVRPVFGVLGSPRSEKGFAEAVQAILELSTEPDPPRCLVVTNRPDAASSPWVQKLRATRLANVELVDEEFESDEDYARLLGRVSALVLPYHLNVYGVRTSGIFCEALASGRAVVVSEESWMSDKAGDAAACLRTPERDPAALARAIRSAVLDSRELSAKARRAAQWYREEFSARGFVSGLMEATHA
ncbi:MAG: glycosyltransferase, partial [Verrucomicrobiota bacterium]